LTEHEPEHHVAERRLREGARVEHLRHAWLTACRVVPVDEVPRRKERNVLDQRHHERESARLEPCALPDFVVRKAEDAAVQGVERKAERHPT
jgi:hypothetical protein